MVSLSWKKKPPKVFDSIPGLPRVRITEHVQDMKLDLNVARSSSLHNGNAMWGLNRGCRKGELVWLKKGAQRAWSPSTYPLYPNSRR
jgi:predicted oxidoreductase